MATARSQRRAAVTGLKRGLILAAARRVFEREGLEGASLRAIAAEAGYSAAALYFHFPNKEAVYGAVLAESLDRLIAAVKGAVTEAGQGSGVGAEQVRLCTAALAFFDFYAENPRDLDLGFYLFRGGMRPRGLSPELDRELNRKLAEGLAPIRQAARALGASEPEAGAIVAGCFGHASGLLLLQHTGRIRLFGCRPRALMEGYLDVLVTRLPGGGACGRPMTEEAP